MNFLKEWKIQFTWKFLLYAVLLVGAVILIYFVASNLGSNEFIRNSAGKYGYPGLVVLGFISGFNVVIPIPAASLIPIFIEVGLNFWMSILFITLGMTIGDSIGYIVGRAGETILTKEGSTSQKLADKIERLRQRHQVLPFVVLALYATFAPAPNELIIVPMGFMGYKLKKIVPLVFLGNLVFNTYFAYGVKYIFTIF